MGFIKRLKARKKHSSALIVAGSPTLPMLQMSEGNFSLIVMIYGTRPNAAPFSATRASRLQTVRLSVV